jgi:probable selenium-dependent hydroxylase accessory protein YqeC
MPPMATTVIPVAGLDAVGRPLDGEVAHRLDVLASMGMSGPVTSDMLGLVLGSRQGGRKSVPPGAAVVPLLNKTDTLSSEAGQLAELAASVAMAGAFRELAVSDLRNGLFARLVIPE